MHSSGANKHRSLRSIRKSSNGTKPTRLKTKTARLRVHTKQHFFSTTSTSLDHSPETTTSHPTDPNDDSTNDGPPLNKILSQTGNVSRRSAVTLIKENKVLVNGQIITNPAYRPVFSDHITVLSNRGTNGFEILPQESIQKMKLDGKFKHTFILLNKPPGYVCSKPSLSKPTPTETHKPPTVFDLLPKEFHNVNYLGRLDQNSSGMLLFSNDGTLVNNITHPSNEIDKEYIVQTREYITKQHMNRMFEGIWDRNNKEKLQAKSILKLKQPIYYTPEVQRQQKIFEQHLRDRNTQQMAFMNDDDDDNGNDIEGQNNNNINTIPDNSTPPETGPTINAEFNRHHHNQYSIVLNKGHKREIRRMIAVQQDPHHNQVVTLHRVRVGSLIMDQIPVGGYKVLSEDDIKKIFIPFEGLSAHELYQHQKEQQELNSEQNNDHDNKTNNKNNDNNISAEFSRRYPSVKTQYPSLAHLPLPMESDLKHYSTAAANASMPPIRDPFELHTHKTPKSNQNDPDGYDGHDDRNNNNSNSNNHNNSNAPRRRKIEYDNFGNNTSQPLNNTNTNTNRSAKRDNIDINTINANDNTINDDDQNDIPTQPKQKQARSKQQQQQQQQIPSQTSTLRSSFPENLFYDRTDEFIKRNNHHNANQARKPTKYEQKYKPRYKASTSFDSDNDEDGNNDSTLQQAPLNNRASSYDFKSHVDNFINTNDNEPMRDDIGKDGLEKALFKNPFDDDDDTNHSSTKSSPRASFSLESDGDEIQYGNAGYRQKNRPSMNNRGYGGNNRDERFNNQRSSGYQRDDRHGYDRSNYRNNESFGQQRHNDRTGGFNNNRRDNDRTGGFNNNRRDNDRNGGFNNNRRDNDRSGGFNNNRRDNNNNRGYNNNVDDFSFKPRQTRSFKPEYEGSHNKTPLH